MVIIRRSEQKWLAGMVDANLTGERGGLVGLPIW